MAYSGNTGIKRLQKACIYSWQGFQSAFKHEEAFRQEVFVLIIAIPLAVWLGDTVIEKILLIGSIFILMITELLNSAVEAAIDRFGGEIHKLSKRAKDIAAAAVFVAIINALMTWIWIIIA